MSATCSNLSTHLVVSVFCAYLDLSMLFVDCGLETIVVLHIIVFFSVRQQRGLASGTPEAKRRVFRGGGSS